MAIQNFFTSRDNKLDGNTYVGQLGRLWYNPDTNSIYASDGATVGGVPVDLATGANAAFDGITVNTIASDDSTEVKFISDVTFDDQVTVNGNLVVIGNISAAAPNKIGGIAPGPGVNISNTGLLTIDSANLSFSFGNFTANNNILTIVNSDEDMILETQGNAEIQLIGNVGFYRENGMPPDPSNRFFQASDTGQLTITVETFDTVGAVEIIGSTSGNSIPPGITGAMLHITGETAEDCRMYYDGVGGYVSFVGRRYNGTVASPTQVLSGQDVLRINATAATDAGVGNVAMAQISATALENQTTTAQGSSLTFTVTPVGQSATNRVDVANVTVANGVTATKFTTSGNIDGGNLNLTGNIVADYVLANNVGSTGNVEIESNETYWYFTTDNRFVGTGNIEAGNVAATTFTGNVVGNVTGTATTATNLAAATSILAGTIAVNPAEVAGTASSTQTFTLTGLTTSHKIIITSGTAINSGLVIAAAWASALNTVSIEFRNTTNQAIDAGNLTIQYFAWV